MSEADNPVVPAAPAALAAPGTVGLSAAALAPYAAPRRSGDPLGLGRARPPPPPDPDPHDLAAETEGYVRSLLPEGELALLDAENEKRGYDSIDDIRRLVAENTPEGAEGAVCSLDPGLLMLIDTRTNYKVFVSGEDLYTRAELYAHYAFHEFGIQPEAVFEQQELGVFAVDGDLEYLARDAGGEDFEQAAALMGAATRRRSQGSAPALLKVVKTKVYIGRERWADFRQLQCVARGLVRVATVRAAQPGAAPAPLLAGGFPLLTALAPLASQDKIEQR